MVWERSDNQFNDSRRCSKLTPECDYDYGYDVYGRGYGDFGDYYDCDCADRNAYDDEECDGVYDAVGGKNEEYLKPSTTAKAVKQPDGRMKLTDVPDQKGTYIYHPICTDHRRVQP